MHLIYCFSIVAQCIYYCFCFFAVAQRLLHYLSFQFASDFNGEDRFLTRIGVGGLINLEKMRQAHVVLNDIHLFQEHARNMALKVIGHIHTKIG